MHFSQRTDMKNAFCLIGGHENLKIKKSYSEARGYRISRVERLNSWIGWKWPTNNLLRLYVNYCH